MNVYEFVAADGIQQGINPTELDGIQRDRK